MTKNYIICTFLKTFRSVNGNHLFKKQSYFETYEKIIKDLIESPTSFIGLMDNFKTVSVIKGGDEVPARKVISWVMVKKPDTFIYAYTPNRHRRQGNAMAIFKELRNNLCLDNENPVLKMPFFTKHGFLFLNSDKAKNNFYDYQIEKEIGKS